MQQTGCHWVGVCLSVCMWDGGVCGWVAGRGARGIGPQKGGSVTLFGLCKAACLGMCRG